MKKLLPKDYFSLEEVAKRLSVIIDDKVSPKDLLQLGFEGKLRMQARILKGHRWRILDELDQQGVQKLKRYDVKHEALLSKLYYVDVKTECNQLMETGRTRIFKDDEGFLYSEEQHPEGEDGWARDRSKQGEIFYATKVFSSMPYIGRLEDTVGVEVSVDQVFIQREDLLRFETKLLEQDLDLMITRKPYPEGETAELNNKRALAIMAWILAEQKPAFSIGGRPNVDAIGKAVDAVAAKYFGEDIRGFKAFHKKLGEALKTLSSDA